MKTDIHIERIVGEGRQSVYAYHYPSQYKHCGDYPIKIGAAKKDPIARILRSQSAMQERPSVDLIIKCHDAQYLEQAIHNSLKDKRLVGSFGDEWFVTNRDDVLCAWLKYISPDETDVGAQLRYYRRAIGLSQEQLADFADVRQATISKIEKTGDATISLVNRIANEIGLELRLTPKQ